MGPQVSEPVLQTHRLVLRPVVPADAMQIEALAGAREIADGTLTIPHPYPPGAAQQWMLAQDADHQKNGSIVLAITTRETGMLCGTIGLHVDPKHRRAELGYWIGVPYWNRGYVTEAARVVMQYGFETLGLRRIYAMHYTSNPASGRVLQKLGMRYEGCLRQHIHKWEEFRDLEVYGILAEEWDTETR
jgi:ribosomal-protein-alanine N-acetyltransferase